MWKTPKMQKRLSKIGARPYYTDRTRFFLDRWFSLGVDNVELIMYMIFQKLLMTGWRDMDKKHLNEWMQRCVQKTSKMPQKWGFSPICYPPRFFFKNSALSLLYPYGTPTSCKKIRKNNERSISHEIFRDGPTYHGRMDGGQGRLLRTPSDKLWVQHSRWYLYYILIVEHWICV